MAKGKRRQQQLWVETESLAKASGHPFYERLSKVLDEHSFDTLVEEQSAKFYAPKMGLLATLG